MLGLVRAGRSAGKRGLPGSLHRGLLLPGARPPVKAAAAAAAPDHATALLARPQVPRVPPLPVAALGAALGAVAAKRGLAARRRSSADINIITEAPPAELEVVAIDTEFVGVGKNTVVFGGSRNALARVSIVAPGRRVLLDTFVQISEPVVDYRISITGITQEAIDSGITFEEAQAWVAHLLHGRLVVGHSVGADWRVLDWQPPEHLIRDTSVYRPLRPVPNKKAKLVDLATHHLGREIQLAAHDSVEDAATALEVYMLVRDEWEKDLAQPKASRKKRSKKATEATKENSEELEGTVAPVSVPPASRPPPPGEAPPTGAEAVVAKLASAAADLRSRSWTKNVALARAFAQMAERSGGKAKFAKLHFQRAASTFGALPYELTSSADLERPELRCIGKPGSFSRTFAERLLGEPMPA